MKDQILEAIKYLKLDISDYADASDLSEAIDYNGSLPEIIDGTIDTYYYTIRKWAVDNWEYVEEAMEEGLCDGETDYHKIIQSGQYIYYQREANEAIEEIFSEFEESSKC